MRVRSGWNSEPYGRRKFDIELGEEDLVRILTSRGIDPATVLPLREAFSILYCEAEALARAALVRHLEHEEAPQEAVDTVKAEIEALHKERNAVLAPHRPKPRAASKAREPAGT